MAQEVLTTPGSGSWVCPADVYSVIVETWGGGGHGQDGGGSPSGGANPGGGGGGAYASKTVTVVPGNSYPYVVGAAEQDSTWNTSEVVAKAGTRGSGGLGQPGGQAASCTGDVKYSGGTGANAGAGPGGGGGGAAGPNGAGGNASSQTGGTGNNGANAGGAAGQNNGVSQVDGGGGGGGGNNNAIGGNGGAPGGGGGGGEDSNGAGARGQIRLTYFKNYAATKTETISVSELLTAGILYIRTKTESIAVTEFLSRIIGKTVSEALTLTETKVVIFIRSFSESFTITETVRRYINQFGTIRGKVAKAIKLIGKIT